MYAFHAGLGSLKELKDFVNDEGIEKLQELMSILYAIQDMERRTQTGAQRVG